MEKNLKAKSKFLSLVLRHQPEVAGLVLDEAGWTSVADLLAGCAKVDNPITRDELDAIIRTNEKQRFALSEDGQRIRAHQGHSVEVELGYLPQRPPALLYHGTAKQFVSSIRQNGLQKRARHQVHLSESIESTMQVGQRRGVPVLVTIKAGEMSADGYEFFKTPNGVWLTDFVPVNYLIFPGDEPEGERRGG
jgi:putative RNA 2'-phosphotransferase